MGEVSKGYESASLIHWHIVFPVKYRKRLVDQEIRSTIVQAANGLAARYSIEMEDISGIPNHIQLARNAHHKVAPDAIGQTFGSVTDREMLRRKAAVKEGLREESSGQATIVLSRLAGQPAGKQ